MNEPPPKPQRQPSRPELPISVDKVVGAAGKHGVSQEYVRPELTRKFTVPGGFSTVPQPPPLPTESKTVRAPSTTAQTVRVTPAAGIRIPPDENASEGLQSAQESILRDELARERGELARERAMVAEFERQARVAAESKAPGPYQKPIERSQSPVPSSTSESKPPSRGDWAKLRYKVATAAVAAVVLVIAALGYWAVTAINAKTEAIKAAQDAKKRADSREELWRQWASVVIWIEDCRDSRDVRSGEMLLPDPQKMGSARKLEPWQNPCSPKLPPPP